MTQNHRTDDPPPTVRRCGAHDVHMRLLLSDKGYAQKRSAIENHAWRAARMPAAARAGCTRIPVVVHVVYRTAAENISRAQIDSQLVVLNADFRRRNADVGSVPSAFRSVVADARIEFALATLDPSGNPTDGVVRVSTTVSGFTDDDSVKAATTGGADPWPTDKYLNIWVCRLSGGLLGYAQFPGGPASTDGVVITHTGFGTTGTAAAPFNLGRTTVHEIGHWLNLFHIWGDDGTGCSGSDFVADTPNQAGPNMGTPAFPSVSCSNGPSGDMFMNYMDYTDDAGMVMFTAGQVVRMQAALDGPRSSIGSAIPCGIKPKFSDEPTKFKFRDDIATTKIRDELGKFTRDPIFTSKLRDDIGTLKALDDVKTPALDKPPIVDLGIPSTPIGLPMVASASVAPFILATPHHSNAWQESDAHESTEQRDAWESQLAVYEQTFESFKAAEAAGETNEKERARIAELYAEYSALAEDYSRRLGIRSV